MITAQARPPNVELLIETNTMRGVAVGNLETNSKPHIYIVKRGRGTRIMYSFGLVLSYMPSFTSKGPIK